MNLGGPRNRALRAALAASLVLSGCAAGPAGRAPSPAWSEPPSTVARPVLPADTDTLEIIPTARPSADITRRLPLTGTASVDTTPMGAGVRDDLVPPPSSGPFAINLYRKGDFVSQARVTYCVPAAIQTMINVMERGANRSTGVQDRYYRLARRYSTPRLVGPGAEPEGWATTLEKLGYGPYGVTAERTRTAAIRVAARALRLTGRPVGLLMWRGAHAWVMTGFRATADPAYTDRYLVTDVYVADVWYPRVSSIWGPSRPPNARVPVDALRQDYLRWRRPAVRYVEKDGRFVVVLPEPHA